MNRAKAARLLSPEFGDIPVLVIFVLVLGFREPAGPEQRVPDCPARAAAMATVQAAYSSEESGRRARRDPAAEDASPPVLLLSHFCAVPFLCFGDVRVGTSRTRSLVLHNPHAEPLHVELSLLRAAGQGFSASPNLCELQVGARDTSPWRHLGEWQETRRRPGSAPSLDGGARR